MTTMARRRIRKRFGVQRLLFMGGVGSAKTTAVNSCLPALRHHRHSAVILVEDDPELFCPPDDRAPHDECRAVDDWWGRVRTQVIVWLLLALGALGVYMVTGSNIAE